MKDKPITTDELAEIFGETMPWEAVALMDSKTASLSEIREGLRKLAAKEAARPLADGEMVEHVRQQIKAAELAMIEERKGQYGSAFKAEQRIAIEGMHRQQLAGANLMAEALAPLLQHKEEAERERANTIEALQAERDCAKECLAGVHKYAADIEARLDRVRELIESGYRGVDKADQCEHGRYGFEDCISCYDEALTKALNGERM